MQKQVPCPCKAKRRAGNRVIFEQDTNRPYYVIFPSAAASLQKQAQALGKKKLPSARKKRPMAQRNPQPGNRLSSEQQQGQENVSAALLPGPLCLVVFSANNSTGFVAVRSRSLHYAVQASRADSSPMQVGERAREHVVSNFWNNCEELLS